MNVFCETLFMHINSDLFLRKRRWESAWMQWKSHATSHSHWHTEEETTRCRVSRHKLSTSSFFGSHCLCDDFKEYSISEHRNGRCWERQSRPSWNVWSCCLEELEEMFVGVNSWHILLKSLQEVQCLWTSWSFQSNLKWNFSFTFCLVVLLAYGQRLCKTFFLCFKHTSLQVGQTTTSLLLTLQMQ